MTLNFNLSIKKESLNRLRTSKAWDSRYNLPTFPTFNNPWIYMAYAALLLKQSDERRAWATLEDNLREYIQHCEVDVGLIDRWSDGAGGSTSHDEIMGAAYLDTALAGRIVWRLREENGRYDNKETDRSISDQEYRFVFLMPYLRTCAGEKIGKFSQLVWCLHVLHHALTHKTGEESETLKIWLMLDVMEKYTLCRWIGSFWESRMRKHGLNGIKDIFSYYLNDIPELREIATDRF